MQHDILGGINYFNVTIGAVLPWKNEYFGYGYSFYLRAMWELVIVM